MLEVNNYCFRQNDGKRRCYRCDSESHLANTYRHNLAEACRRAKENMQTNSTVCFTNESMEVNEMLHQQNGYQAIDESKC